MISFLSAIIVMIAIGTVVQRADIFSDGEDDVVTALVDDRFVVPANTLKKLDIFENDTGLTDDQKASLTVLSEPACGRVLVGGGIVKYYATDDCAGEQKLVYTLGALSDPQVATVTAFVTSDLHPDIVPGKASEKEDPETPAGDAKISESGEGDSEIAKSDAASSEEGDGASSILSGGASPVEAAIRDDDIEETDDAIDEAKTEDGAVIAGTDPATESSTVLGDALPVDDEAAAEAAIAAIDSDDSSDSDAATDVGGSVEPDRVDIAASPASPQLADETEARILPDDADGKAVSVAPDQPSDETDTDAGGATISLAVVPRRDPALDPSTGGDALVAPETGDGVDELDVGQGAAADTGGDLPKDPGTESAALDPVEIGISDDADDFTEGVPTGKVPIPARRADVLSVPGSGDAPLATSGDAGGEVSKAEDVAALDRVDAEISAKTPETRVPLGADIVITAPDAGVAALDADGGRGLDDPISDRPALSTENLDLSALGTPGTSDASPATDGVVVGAPNNALGPVDELGDADGALGDTESWTKRGGDVPDRVGRGGESVTDDRAAALDPALAGVPASDALRSGDAEPDPVERSAKPSDLASQTELGALAGLDVGKIGSSVPDAERTAALVDGRSSTDYSFFSRIPRSARIVGRNKDASAVDPESSSGPTAADDATVNTAALGVPELGSEFPGIKLDPGTAPGEPLTGFVVDPDEKEPAPAESKDDKVAGLPAGDSACTQIPSSEMEIRRAARTVVRITAPCQADTVAELSYSGLRLAIPLDRQGNGSVLALGFEANADAIVTFQNGETLDFELAFRNIDKVDRVAVIWDTPISLELHALENGARTGDDAHVHPGNRREYGDVRRSGGGFLHEYRANAGVGQNAQVYTYWRRRGSGGVVKLMIDFASRNRDRLIGTCGDGPYAAPGFQVLRSVAGRIERPITRRLASIDCSSVSREIGDKRLISGAIDDLVIAN